MKKVGWLCLCCASKATDSNKELTDSESFLPYARSEYIQSTFTSTNAFERKFKHNCA